MAGYRGNFYANRAALLILREIGELSRSKILNEVSKNDKIVQITVIFTRQRTGPVRA